MKSMMFTLNRNSMLTRSTPSCLQFVVLALCAIGILGCQPKSTSRWQNDKEKVTSLKGISDEDASVRSFSNGELDLNELQKSADEKTQAFEKVLRPLSVQFFNVDQLKKTEARTQSWSTALSVFHQALLQELEKPNTSAEFNQFKKDYLKTVFTDCQMDLKTTCTLSSYFSADAHFMRVMTILSTEFDSSLNGLLKNGSCASSDKKCADLLTERYRRLALAALNSNRQWDSQFAATYIRFAKPFMTLLNSNVSSVQKQGFYIDLHNQVSTILMNRVKSTELSLDEKKQLIRQLNLWNYSSLDRNDFHEVYSTMFSIGTECCLYADSAKTQVDPALKRTLVEQSQQQKRNFPSLLQITQNFQRENKSSVLKDFGVADMAQLISSQSDLAYNEVSYVVDRVFYGDLTFDQAQAILKNLNPQRFQSLMPQVLDTYLKMYLIYMTEQTNQYMKSIVRSDIGSTQIFGEVISRSKALTSRWYALQTQFQAVERALTQFYTDHAEWAGQYQKSYIKLKSVSRTIHYMSVYPQMLILNYYLGKMKGKVKVATAWGPLEINAETILDSIMTAKNEAPWFHFGQDTLPLDRLGLLYGFDFLQRAQSYSVLSEKSEDGTISDLKTLQTQLFNLIVSSFLGKKADELSTSITAFNNTLQGDNNFKLMNTYCTAEINPTAKLPTLSISFKDLGAFSYGGTGNRYLMQSLNNVLTNGYQSYQTLLNTTMIEAQYIKVVRNILASNAKSLPVNQQPNLQEIDSTLKRITSLSQGLNATFIKNHKTYFECYDRLKKIERARFYKIIDEESARLSAIFTELKALKSVSDSAVLAQKTKQLNEKYFSKSVGYKFDRVEGNVYYLSKYDLLLRIKKKVENADWSKLTDKLALRYDLPPQWMQKSRPVVVTVPEGIERDDMVTSELSQALSLNTGDEADRQEFIHSGLAAIAGQATGYLTHWSELADGNVVGDSKGQIGMNYLKTLILSFQLDNQVTAETVVSHFSKVVSDFFMSDLDVKLSKILGFEGRLNKEFFKQILIANDGVTPLPFYTALTQMLFDEAQLKTDDRSLLDQSLDLAISINAQQEVLFNPNSKITQDIFSLYGDMVTRRLVKSSDLFKAILKVGQSQNQIPAVLKRPLFLIDGSSAFWKPTQSVWLDSNKLLDFRALVQDFTARSGNFFKTRESLSLP